MLDVFHLEPEYEKNDEEWNEIKVEILGEQNNLANNPDAEMEDEEEAEVEDKKVL